MALVGFCGSRALPRSVAPRLASVLAAVLASHRSLAVGCAVGVDAAVIRHALRASAAPRLSVFAAFGPVSPPWPSPRVSAPGASSSVSSVSGVAAALRAHAAVSWWAGGGPELPLVARLAGRSATLVYAVAASGPGSGLVAFVSSKCPPHLRPVSSPSAAFSGHGSGSWGSLALAAGLGLPVVVFPLPSSGYGCGPALPDPSWGSWLSLPGGWRGGFLLAPREPVPALFDPDKSA